MAVTYLYNYRKVLAAISLAWLRYFFLNIEKCHPNQFPTNALTGTPKRFASVRI